MTEITSRVSSALADRYRIERELGRGGMDAQFVVVVVNWLEALRKRVPR